MKCSQCGAELEGKFCTNCGAPAPTPNTEPEPVIPVSDVQSEPASVNDVQPGFAEPQNNPYNAEQPQPIDYNSTPNGTSYGQQFTNQPNGTYAGQQFTNQPNNVYPNGKKPMSGGKIAAIVISIILGIIIILGVIIGVVACSIFNTAKNSLSKYASSNISDDINEFSSALDDLSSFIDEYADDSSSNSSYSDNSASSYANNYYYDDEEVFDEETGFTFEWSDDYNGWSVVDYSKTDYDTAKFTLTIPSEFQGKSVVEIDRVYVYDNDSSEKGYLKVVIPGSVKVIDDDAFAFLQDINEVVIEDGVIEIDENAFAGDNDLTVMHIPASVTSLEESYIGYYCDDNYKHTSMGKDFTMYCVKGSAAETYAKKNGFTIKYE